MPRRPADEGLRRGRRQAYAPARPGRRHALPHQFDRAWRRGRGAGGPARRDRARRASTGRPITGRWRPDMHLLHAGRDRSTPPRRRSISASPRATSSSCRSPTPIPSPRSPRRVDVRADPARRAFASPSLAQLKHPYSVDLYVGGVASPLPLRAGSAAGRQRTTGPTASRNLSLTRRARAVSISAVVPGDYQHDARLDAASTLPVGGFAPAVGFLVPRGRPCQSGAAMPSALSLRPYLAARPAMCDDLRTRPVCDGNLHRSIAGAPLPPRRARSSCSTAPC